MSKRKTKRRRARRPSIYTARLSLPLRPETLAELERIADAELASVSAVCRDAVEAGLPTVKRRMKRNR